jgi:hypothetical protein
VFTAPPNGLAPPFVVPLPPLFVVAPPRLAPPAFATPPVVLLPPLDDTATAVEPPCWLTLVADVFDDVFIAVAPPPTELPPPALRFTQTFEAQVSEPLQV